MITLRMTTQIANCVSGLVPKLSFPCCINAACYKFITACRTTEKSTDVKHFSMHFQQNIVDLKYLRKLDNLQAVLTASFSLVENKVKTKHFYFYKNRFIYVQQNKCRKYQRNKYICSLHVHNINNGNFIYNTYTSFTLFAPIVIIIIRFIHVMPDYLAIVYSKH